MSRSRAAKNATGRRGRAEGRRRPPRRIIITVEPRPPNRFTLCLLASSCPRKGNDGPRVGFAPHPAATGAGAGAGTGTGTDDDAPRRTRSPSPSLLLFATVPLPSPSASPCGYTLPHASPRPLPPRRLTANRDRGRGAVLSYRRFKLERSALPTLVPDSIASAEILASTLLSTSALTNTLLEFMVKITARSRLTSSEEKENRRTSAAKKN